MSSDATNYDTLHARAMGLPSIYDLHGFVKLPQDNNTHLANLEKAYAEARSIIDGLLDLSAPSETAATVGEVIGHKEMGLALVQWADNGLRPIGTKVYAAPHSAPSAGIHSGEDLPAAVAAPFKYRMVLKFDGFERVVEGEYPARPSATVTPEARVHQQFADCIRNLVNDSAFDLRDSPKSFIGQVERMVKEMDAALLVQEFPEEPA